MDALQDILADSPAYLQLMAAAAARQPPHSLILEVQDPSLGRALVQAWLACLYCQDIEGTIPCGSCLDCGQVAGGTHPGVVHIEPDGNSIRVEQVREDVLSRVGERVPGGRHHVFVFHGAECLRDESGNTLLKAIEEPPPGTVFVLLAEDRQAVLGTIRSRSREVAVPLPPLGRLVEPLGEDAPTGVGALLAAGLAPGIVQRLRRDGAPTVEGPPLETLAAAELSELTDGELLADPRASAHRPAVASTLFGTALEMLVDHRQSARHSRRAHAYTEVTSTEARTRAKAIKSRMLKEWGEGYQHPTLRRDAAFGRLAATRAAEDVLRALTAACAAALRLRAGSEPYGLVTRFPGLAGLAARPSAWLLGAARRVRRAREPLRRNQNMRMLFDELFLDLEEARLG